MLKIIIEYTNLPLATDTASFIGTLWLFAPITFPILFCYAIMIVISKAIYKITNFLGNIITGENL